MKLSKLFYDRDTCQVAQDLLGKYLVRVQNGIPLVVRIQETEAYVGPMDKACHAYNYRRTARTETLFAPPGTAYIYLIYGMYHCLNFVTEPEGTPCAVLLRGGAARAGIAQMAQNRYGRSPDELTPYQRKNFLNGPGKLCKALSLTKAQNGISLGCAVSLRPAGGCRSGHAAGGYPALRYFIRAEGGNRLRGGGSGVSLAVSDQEIKRRKALSQTAEGFFTLSCIYTLLINCDAAFSIMRFVPTLSKATSTRASPPMGWTERTMPVPKAAWRTISPFRS